jgi:LPS O-antigen subunit length determinant protein (WzzB/FepE family)
MKFKKKINSSEEIDIEEIIIKIWNNKKIIYFTTLLSVMFFFIHILVNSSGEKYKSNTIIKTISKNQVHNYNEFNEYIDLVRVFAPDEFAIYDYNFSKINEKILFQLFTEKLKDKNYLAESIKKFEFIKKENFENDKDYEYALNNLLSRIEIKLEGYNNNLDLHENANIIFKTSDKLSWENFISYIEKDINLKIRKFLNERFEEEMNKQEIVKKFLLEDIKNKFEMGLKNQEYLNELEDKKKILLKEKHLAAIKNLFDLTPIRKLDDFSSVKIFKPKFDKNILLLSNFKLFIFTCLFGVILGSLYILVSEKIHKVYYLLSKKK